jgi:O-antigen ligase
MIQAHPWWGVGPGQVRKVFERYIPADIPRPLPPGAYIHMHNVYLQYAVERGIPALLAFLWWVGKMFWDFARAPRKDWILRGVMAAMIAVLAAGWYEHNLGDGEVLTVFLGLCASAYVTAEGIWPTNGHG